MKERRLREEGEGSSRGGKGGGEDRGGERSRGGLFTLLLSQVCTHGSNYMWPQKESLGSSVIRRPDQSKRSRNVLAVKVGQRNQSKLIKWLHSPNVVSLVLRRDHAERFSPLGVCNFPAKLHVK